MLSPQLELFRNGTILGESTDIYPNTIAKAYDVLCK